MLLTDRQPLFTDQFLEEASEEGYEVAGVFGLIHTALVKIKDGKKRWKRGKVMRSYMSAFDRIRG